MEIDTLNRFAVGTQGEKTIIMFPPTKPMTAAEALTLAAWLVAVVGKPERFAEILKAVENS